MAATSWMRYPNTRYGRFQKGRYQNKEDDINFDVNSDSRQNVTNILTALCHISDISDGKRLNYLNAFVKVTLHIEGNFESIGFNMRDILCCLRIALLHESTQVRSGGLRAIRHVLRNEDDIAQLNKLLIPFLIARSLDLVLKNDVERIEAMKLIRKILLLSPSNFHVALGRSLVSLANGGVEEKDRLLRICLATLCELGVVNTSLFIETGGVAAVTRNLLECQTPKISESLCGVLLSLLDKPATRNHAGVDLHSIAAPYCDFHYRHGWKDKDKYVDERELRFNCSRLALLSILRSWPGILHFCGPANKAGLRAVVEVLYLNQLEVRKAVLDLLYELLGLPQPEWTDEFSVALSAVDPSEPQSSWRLNEGFVAAEGRSILPHLAKTTPSITDMHLALLLYSFLECGLLGAIVEVIATSDTFISVRATVLLGELLHLIQVLLPPECCNISPALPSLLEYATCGNPQAVKAVNGLQQLQKLLRMRPASYSLYLDFIMRSGGNVKFASKNNKKSRHKLKTLKVKLQQLVGKDGDDVIKETGVLINKDAYTWNWNLIRIVLKGESVKLDLSDATHRNFMKRLVDFYTPSRNRYSHMDLTTAKISTAYTLTGIDLINCLLDLDHEESSRMLRDLFADISGNISAITSGRSVHDCLFSPQHMNSTQCQSYFLFVGRLTSTDLGTQLLSSLDVFRKLEHLATTTNNDCYVKLIVSSLDYGNVGPCRELLGAVLRCPVESSRLYATQFLLVLLRAGIGGFCDWGVKFLVNQLRDKARSVYLTALNILHEACELQSCLETLVKLNPNMGSFGEKGSLLAIRLLSVASGFQVLNKNDFVLNEIKRWDDYFSCRYIKLVEGETSDVLTLHQRDEDGKYDKRTSAIRMISRKDFFLPPHLYGQLARHTDGFLMLIHHGSLEAMLQTVTTASCHTEDDILKLKAALWALGHFGSTSEGLRYLILHNCLAAMIVLAQDCLVFSIRATSYYSLGLIATTRQGADELFKLGWFCTRHNRHIAWPIIEEEAWEDDSDDSLRLPCAFPDISSTLYFFDSGIKDVEGSTDDDTSESLVALPDSIIAGPQKSLTLPANQNQPSAYHKRSLSESKTFEIIRAPSDSKKGSFRLGTEIVRRVRNNSTTESTTSGVSSCDSVGGGRSVVYERQQLLSPIPSSCSLSTLKQSGQKVRRHSESSRRVSVQSGSNSDKSLQSLVGGVSGKLSHQDLIGYATLRALRKSPRYLEEPAYDADEVVNDSLWDVPISLIEDCNLLEMTNSSIKRFSVHDGGEESDERCYMGISLPGDIHNLFLDVEEEVKDVPLERFPIIEDEVVCTLHDFKVREETLWKHEAEMCFVCSGKAAQEVEVFVAVPGDFVDSKYDPNSPDGLIKAHVLQLIDQFSNPVWCKQVKQSLLQCKQGSPQVFQDPCLFSEVCKLLSECTYRLSPRRMLHELFLDVKYDDLYAECADILKNAQNEIDSGKSSGDSIDTSEGAQPSSNIKQLDSLKLAYKENKFPIRNRNESKIV
ncbi:hypothetical protein Zmor_025609 [Zophobas morio]|uniref:Rapamycin-insensitive companion of mTOR n=1 Tax=Zophobas morio TaxID=2755281 RepID=A0AA38M3T0_9CUCU|nr:hypothetical protein Zmor_025609 [Zophobas morio]